MVFAAVLGAALLLALSMFVLRKRAMSRRRSAAASRQGSTASAAAWKPAAGDDPEAGAGVSINGVAHRSEREQWLEQELSSLQARMEATLAALRS